MSRTVFSPLSGDTGSGRTIESFPGVRWSRVLRVTLNRHFLAKVNRQIFAEDFCAHLPVRSAHIGTAPLRHRPTKNPPLKEQHQQEEKEQQDRIVESGHKHNYADCIDGGYDDLERSWFAVVTG